MTRYYSITLILMTLVPPTLAASEDPAMLPIERPLFPLDEPSSSWFSINDNVMGGVSRGGGELTEDGHLIFRGTLSMENNGGFASIRSPVEAGATGGFDGIVLRVRGDGRTYQLRARVDDRFDGVAYRATFDTEGKDWQEVRIPFGEFLPTFRGRILRDAPALDPDRIRQIGFLIADKIVRPFRLEVARIAAYRDPAGAAVDE